MMQQQKVLFSTTHQVQFGEIMKVVGQGPQLGKWDVSKAPGIACLAFPLKWSAMWCCLHAYQTGFDNIMLAW